MGTKYTQEIAYTLAQNNTSVIKCFMCARFLRQSFSPYSNFLKSLPEFNRELKSWKPKAPHFYLSKDVLVFIYKNNIYTRMSLADVGGLLLQILEECKRLGITHIVVPMESFIIETGDSVYVESIFTLVSMEGVELYYF